MDKGSEGLLIKNNSIFEFCTEKANANCPNCSHFKPIDGEIEACRLCGLGRTRGGVMGSDEQDYVKRTDKEIEERRRYFSKLYNNYFSENSKGRLLDVGCADSLLVNMFEQHGWCVAGVDTYYDLDVSDRRLRRMSLFDVHESERYDLITMVHSFEHMPDPVRVIQKCTGLLTEEGKLLIVVPNFGGAWSRNTGEKWQWRCVEHHWFHYTINCLVAILHQNNLQVLNVRTCSEHVPSVSQARREIRGFYEHGLASIQPFRSILFRINTLTRPIHNLILDKLVDGAEIQVLASKCN